MTLLKAKVINLTREEAEKMRPRLKNMGHPTLNELCSKQTTVWNLTFLPKGQGYRIERKRYINSLDMP